MSVSSCVRIAIKVLLIVLIFPIVFYSQAIAKLMLKVAQDAWTFLKYIVDEW